MNKLKIYKKSRKSQNIKSYLQKKRRKKDAKLLYSNIQICINNLKINSM